MRWTRSRLVRTARRRHRGCSAERGSCWAPKPLWWNVASQLNMAREHRDDLCDKRLVTTDAGCLTTDKRELVRDVTTLTGWRHVTISVSVYCLSLTCQLIYRTWSTILEWDVSHKVKLYIKRLHSCRRVCMCLQRLKNITTPAYMNFSIIESCLKDEFPKH